MALRLEKAGWSTAETVVSVKLCKKGFGDVSLFGRTRPFLCPDLVMHWASGAGAVKDDTGGEFRRRARSSHHL
jgi:hypothetical protein